MKIATMILLFLLIGFPVQAAMLLQDTPVSEIRLVATYPDQGVAVIRDVVNGQEVQIAVGDAIGFDEAVVESIEEYLVRLKIGEESKKLKCIPQGSIFTTIGISPGN